MIMKKNLLVNGIAIFIACCSMSCNSSFTDEHYQQEEKGFEDSFASFKAAKRTVLNSVATRSANDTLSYNDMIVMAEELDSLNKAFYHSHPKLAKRVRKVVESDQVEIMKINPDSLMSFVKDNYSDEIYNCVRGHLVKAGCLSSIYNLKTTGATVSTQDDRFIVDNIETTLEFAGKTKWDKNPNFSYKTKTEYCLDQYKNRKSNCYKSYITNCVIAGLGIVVSAPSTVGAAVVWTVSVSLVCEAYRECLYDAYCSYMDCLK